MIYFVLCPSYHGATLLSLLLNRHPRLIGLGDGNPPRDRDPRCACGSRVSQCEFWSALRAALDADGTSRSGALLPRIPQFTGSDWLDVRLTWLIASLPPSMTRRLARIVPPLRDFRDSYSRVLERCQSLKAGAHYVDGEKSVTKYRICRSLGFDVRGVVHVIRDPRGYVDSVLHYRPDTSIDAATMEWCRRHRLISQISNRDRYHRVRYEALVSNTEDCMQKLYAFLEVPPMPSSASQSGEKPMHVIGNRMLRNFDGTIVDKQRWRRRLTPAQQDRILELAEPLYSSFEYPAHYAATPSSPEETVRP